MSIQISEIAPIVGGKVVYQRLAPATVGGPFQARISVAFDATGTGQIKTVTLGGHPVIVAKRGASDLQLPGEFQNYGSGSSGVAGALVIDEPVPPTMVLKVQSTDGTTGETVLALAAHTNQEGPLSWVGPGDEHLPNEAWTTSSSHKSDHQVFALDATISGWDGSNWKQGYVANPTRTYDWRVYGRAVYAPAKGEVVAVVKDHEEWVDLESRKAIIDAAPKNAKGDVTDFSSFPQSPTKGYGGGGNHLFVKSGNEFWLVAHLQPHTIPPQIKAKSGAQPGTMVERGQYLGKVGWSGDSTGPHVHLHVKDDTGANADKGRFRPMTFKGLHSLTVAEADAASAKGSLPTSKWKSLTNHSASKPTSLLFSGPSAPSFVNPGPLPMDNANYTAIWHPGSHIDLRVLSPTLEQLEAKISKLCGADNFTLTGIESCIIAGKNYFAGFFKYGKTGYGYQRLTSWDAFVTESSKYIAQGNVLVDMTTFVHSGQRNYVGVFRPGQGGKPPIRIKGIDAFEDEAHKQSQQGVKLSGLNTYVDGNGNNMVIGAFVASAEKQLVRSAVGWDAFAKVIGGQQGMRLKFIGSGPISLPGPDQRLFLGVFEPDTKGTGQMVQAVTSYREVVRRCEKYGKQWRLAHLHLHSS